MFNFKKETQNEEPLLKDEETDATYTSENETYNLSELFKKYSNNIPHYIAVDIVERILSENIQKLLDNLNDDDVILNNILRTSVPCTWMRGNDDWKFPIFRRILYTEIERCHEFDTCTGSDKIKINKYQLYRILMFLASVVYNYPIFKENFDIRQAKDITFEKWYREFFESKECPDKFINYSVVDLLMNLVESCVTNCLRVQGLGENV